jgi:CPA2 family monovalent cation:H+ antiporter-2
MTILAHARELRPDVPVIVRTSDDTDVEKLKSAGAAEIVAEVVEGSLMLAIHTMLLLGVPRQRVLTRLDTARSERYQLMRGFFPGATDDADSAFDSQQSRLQSIMIDSGAAAVGKDITSLGLEDAGTTLVALRRRGVRDADPAVGTRVEADDVLILAGTPEALAKAEILLLQG